MNWLKFGDTRGFSPPPFPCEMETLVSNTFFMYSNFSEISQYVNCKLSQDFLPKWLIPDPRDREYGPRARELGTRAWG